MVYFDIEKIIDRLGIQILNEQNILEDHNGFSCRKR